jgi:acyl-CoA synthetase (AMP-forming)/AMP-acid ligase II
VICRYAMTECPSITSTDPADSVEVVLQTVGRPVPGTEILLTDVEGAPVAPGEVGTVRVRSKCVMRGYWNMPEATAAALTEDGWLIGGDLGRFDEQGNLRLAGRRSDMYIRGGYNVYPVEVENVLAEHPQIASASVIGQTAPVIGEIGVAFVTLKEDGAALSLDAVRAWCRGRIADYKTPDRLIILPDMPLTVQMKVDKNALRRRLAAEQ